MRCAPPIVLLLAAALCAATPATPAAPEKPLVIGPQPVSVAVVSTREELAKQPLLHAADGIAFRLGLESKKAPSAGGLLLYCQWDGQGNTARGWTLDSADDQIVGPVRVRVTQVEPQSKMIDMIKRGMQFQEQRAPGAIYLALIKIPNPGKYDVEVFARDGTLLARDTVEATQDMAPEWRPWRLAGKPAGAVVRRNPAAKDDAPLDVSIAGLPAIPHPPHVLLPDAAAPAKEEGGLRLPIFWPADPSPDLKLTVDQGIVTLVSQTPIVAEPLDNFLVRWWVNGKPAEFAQQANRSARLIQEGGVALPQTPITLRWKVQLDPALLPTKPRDKIELQLMYCPEGWEDAPRGKVTSRTLRAMPLEDRRLGPGDACLLTNKASWTPANP